MTLEIGLLVAGLITMMVLGVPVCFALMGISSLLLLGFFGPNQLYIIIAAYVNQVRSDVLLAIPMFVLMAGFLQMSGIGADIYDTLYKWLCGVRGGLAMATVAATALIAAMSGVAATGTIAMGLIALPAMLERGYNKELALGPILAGGALGPIIPPSTIMIIIASYSSVSTGKLFIGGIIPGVGMAFLFCVYIAVMCMINPSLAPVVPKEEWPSFGEKMKSLTKVIVPIALIVMILGVIYAGICTPTEASGLGAFVAFAYTIFKRKINWKSLQETVLQTTEVSVMLMWIMMSGAAYSSLVNITRMDRAVSTVFEAMNLGPEALLLVIIAIAFVLGMFIDATAIIMIMVPVLLPVINATGLDLYTAMLVLSITICLGMITPPFGVNLFYLKGVSPSDVTLNNLYRAAIPYTALMLLVILLFVIFPQALLWLPNKMFI